ncbi:hypothetical protein ACXR2T_08115 [Leucobacter sp. HY1910]
MKKSLRMVSVAGAILLVMSGSQAASATDPSEIPVFLEEVTSEAWENLTDSSEAALGEGLIPGELQAPAESSQLDELEKQGLLPTPQDSPEVTKEKIEALADAGLLAMNGTWYPISDSWNTPSSWHCGSASSNSRFAMRACVVRVGNAVQPATIVRNLTSIQYNNVSLNQSLYSASGATLAVGGCPSAYFVPYGRAVCSITGNTTVGSAKTIASMVYINTLIADSGWH